MVCDICGKKGARLRRLTRSFGRGRSAFLIEGVPTISCPNCGESYLTADTLKEIERIRLHWRQLNIEQKVPVVNVKKTVEGYAVWVPGLLGCWSQGKTKKEALENIKDAIQAYLTTLEDLSRDKKSL